MVRLLDALLKLDDTAHHGDALLRVDCGLTTKTSDGFGSLLELALASQPPWRLWREEDKNGERSGEHPLKRNRDPVSRIAVEGVEVISNGANDDAADGPEHLQHLSCRGAKLNGHDLRAVLKFDVSGKNRINVISDWELTAGAFAMKMPQGMPSRICAANMTGRELAK